MIRQGSNQTQRLDRVLKGERVQIQGSNGIVKVAGDVEGYVSVQGSNPKVVIGGRIRYGATVILQGSNPTLKHHGKDRGANVVVQGSNAKEVDEDGIGVKEAEALRDQYPDIPVIFETKNGKRDATVLQIQKSPRPRELWGT